MTALDTNVIVYAFDLDGGQKRAIASRLLRGAPQVDIRLPLQVLGELFAVLTRKKTFSRAQARDAVETLLGTIQLCYSSESTLRSAMHLAETDGLSIWDAAIVATATAVGCSILLSEDLQDGRVFDAFGDKRTIQIVNPFRANASLLRELGFG